ncbi:MAG: hypothetical protein LAP38_12025 [Acidobacteriia bacterium]|nr:hypothetical protein [Terriglobia bacterium]
MGFAGTVVFGLALSGWYLGNRIVAADATRVVTAAPTPLPAIPAQPVAQQPPVEDTTPAPPELYLEMAALGSKRDMNYIEKLHSQGFHAYLEINPGDATGCILIGPYAEASERSRARRKLSAAGVLAIETTR